MSCHCISSEMHDVDIPLDHRPLVSFSCDYMDTLVPPSPEKFERIAHVQEEREEQLRHKAREQWRRSQQGQRQASGQQLQLDQQQQDGAQHQRTQAARVIQKTFRGYRTRRTMAGFSLDPSARWLTAIREAQFRNTTKPRPKSALGAPDVGNLSIEDVDQRRPSSARQNWKKAGLVVRRAGHDDEDDSDSDSSSDVDDNDTPEQRTEWRRLRSQANAERRQTARMMGLQYFLEMVDPKHRYGNNLRVYHEEWKKASTNENFFYWLDHGGGRNIELDMCPRDRLEREQVRYLSREERQYYLVKVDAEGRLCWAKNGARIDTTEQFKDSIHGIVPADDPTPAFNPAARVAENEFDDSLSISSSASESSIESRREADRAAKYTNTGAEPNHGLKKVTHFSAATVLDKLLRKSVRKNTWIFVADTSFRLYVGIKDSGAFQHSSFLQGGRISAAGLIKIKGGRLASLSPLSGHYRPPSANFRAFLRSLKGEGADMGHVTISKSYGVLVGLETYAKTRKKGRDFMGKLLRGKGKKGEGEAEEEKKVERRIEKGEGKGETK